MTDFLVLVVLVRLNKFSLQDHLKIALYCVEIILYKTKSLNIKTVVVISGTNYFQF